MAMERGRFLFPSIFTLQSGRATQHGIIAAIYPLLPNVLITTSGTRASTLRVPFSKGRNFMVRGIFKEISTFVDE